MNLIKSFDIEKTICARLEKGEDLLSSISDVCQSEDVICGRIECLGAVQKACVAYYDQDGSEYKSIEINKKLEIIGLIGNVSIKDGKPFVHAHVTFSDEMGITCGGHLSIGTTIYACELLIQKFRGVSMLERAYDKETGLYLWSDQA